MPRTSNSYLIRSATEFRAMDSYLRSEGFCLREKPLDKQIEVMCMIDNGKQGMLQRNLELKSVYLEANLGTELDRVMREYVQNY